MSKRIISTILSLVIVLLTVLPCISGCSKVEDENHYTVLQWLDRVEENFNLLYYSETEPIVKSVSASSGDFETVQIAAEWGIIEPDDEIKFGGLLTKELAADTLVRAMNCVTPAAVDISDSGDVKPLYLDKVMSSVNEGIFTLEAGKFEPKKHLSREEADAALSIARDKWVNFSYGGVSYDKSTVKENVINLGGVRSENSAAVPVQYSVEYTGNTNFVDVNDVYTDNTNKTITFAAGQVPAGLAVDSVLAMPADDVVPMDYAVVVTGITENADGSVTVSTRKAELEDVYDEVDIQQSGVLDFSNAIFYGPDGQRLDIGAGSGDNAVASMGYFADAGACETQPYTNGDYVAKLCSSFASNSNMIASSSSNTGYSDDYVQKLATKKNSTTFKLGDYFSVTLSTQTGDGGVGLGVKLQGKVEADGTSLKVETGFDETVKVESRIKWHWSWFKLKVDELRLSLTDEKTETFGFDCSIDKNLGGTKNTFDDHNKDGKKQGDWSTEAAVLRKIYEDTRHVSKSWHDLSQQAKDASNFKLVDIFIPEIGAHFVIRGELTVDGSLKLTFKQVNTIGVELVNGKLRPFDEKSNSQELDLSAKIELTFRVALEWQLIGIDVADIGVRAGIGAKVSSIMYSYDKSTDSLMEICGVQAATIKPGGSIAGEEGVNISETGLVIQTDETRTTKICSELSVYPILSFYVCSSSSVAGKLFGGIDVKILGENTPLFKAHFDDGVLVSECGTSANDSYGITTGDKLTLNSDYYSVPVSEEADKGLTIVTMPKNATIKDVTITSDDPDVLEVENLLHKTTGLSDSKIKPEFTFRVNSVFAKTGSTKNPEEVSYTFGSWFYDDVAGNPKPQFALTGKKDGIANVTITAGGESVTIPVQVGTGVAPVVSSGALISSKGTYTLAPGEKVQAAFDFIPEDKTIGDISFSSEDNSVATVSGDGLISAVGEGDTKINAVLKCDDKEYTATIIIHVVELQADMSVSNTAIGGNASWFAPV